MKTLKECLMELGVEKLADILHSIHKLDNPDEFFSDNEYRKRAIALVNSESKVEEDEWIIFCLKFVDTTDKENEHEYNHVFHVKIKDMLEYKENGIPPKSYSFMLSPVSDWLSNYVIEDDEEHIRAILDEMFYIGFEDHTEKIKDFSNQLKGSQEKLEAGTAETYTLEELMDFLPNDEKMSKEDEEDLYARMESDDKENDKRYKKMLEFVSNLI